MQMLKALKGAGSFCGLLWGE